MFFLIFVLKLRNHRSCCQFFVDLFCVMRTEISRGKFFSVASSLNSVFFISCNAVTPGAIGKYFVFSSVCFLIWYFFRARLHCFVHLSVVCWNKSFWTCFGLRRFCSVELDWFHVRYSVVISVDSYYSSSAQKVTICTMLHCNCFLLTYVLQKLFLRFNTVSTQNSTV